MARCLVGHSVSVSKFGQIFKSRSNVLFRLPAGVPSNHTGVQLHISRHTGLSAGQIIGLNCHKFTWAARPSPLTRRNVAHGFRSFIWQNEVGFGRLAVENWTRVFSTSGSSNYRDDLQGRARDKLVQTRQKIRETGERVKEKMEDFAVRRENILTIPNLLCGARIVLSPVLGYLVVQKSFECALGVFVIAGLTDLLDGFIARNFKNQQSTFGSFLDPLADKFLVFCLVLSLTCSQLLPAPLTALIIARDACLIGASAYVRYLSLPPPKTWSSYFDATHATARLSPTLISKYNTFVQLLLVACTLASPVFHMENHPFLPVLWYITATTTVASALSYVFSKNTYHILRDLKDKK